MTFYVSVSKKQFILVKLGVLLFVLFFVGDIFFEYHKARDYIKVSATVIDRITSGGSGKRNSSTVREIKVEYVVDGKTYNNKFRVSSYSGKEIGKEIYIYCNPNNPLELRDDFMIGWNKKFVLLPLAILVLLCIGKKEYVRK